MQKEKRASEDEMAGRYHDAMDMNLGKLQEMVRDRKAWYFEIHGSQRVKHDWAAKREQ